MAQDNDSNRRVHWTVHLGRAAREFYDEAQEIVPKDTRTHLRNSRRELLLAIRSLIDERIEDLEPEPERKARDVEIS